MNSMTQRISGSARASTGAASGAGNLLSIIVSPLTPAATRTRCQISSLMNGASRVQGTQQFFQACRIKVKPSAALGGLGGGVGLNSTALDSSTYQSQILMPGEVVQRIGHIIEAGTRCNPASRRAPACLASRERYPTVGQTEFVHRPRGKSLALDIHQHEARGIPQLVAEVPIARLDASACRSADRGSGLRAMAKVTAAAHPYRRRRCLRGNCLRVAFSMAGFICGCIKTGGALGEQRIERNAIDDIQAGR